MFCDVNKSHLLNDLSHSGSCGEWTYLGWHWAERWGTLWTGCQPTAGLTQRDRLWLVSNWFPEQTTSFAWLSNKTKNVQLAPVGQAFSLDENFNSAVYGSICKTVINLWSGDFTLNKWVHRQKKWKETIYSVVFTISTEKLIQSFSFQCWLPCPPTVCWLLHPVLICGMKKKKTNPLPPVGQRPAVFQEFV